MSESAQNAEKAGYTCCQIIGNICPACLLNPCECPVDDRAARELLTRSADTRLDDALRGLDAAIQNRLREVHHLLTDLRESTAKEADRG